MECTCYIKEEDGVEPQIIKCPLCKSAPDLYEACKAIQAEGTRCLDTAQQDKPVRAIYDIDKVDRLARQAIAKVES